MFAEACLVGKQGAFVLLKLCDSALQGLAGFKQGGFVALEPLADGEQDCNLVLERGPSSKQGAFVLLKPCDSAL